MHYFLGNILIENPMVVILHKRFAYWKYSIKTHGVWVGGLRVNKINKLMDS